MSPADAIALVLLLAVGSAASSGSVAVGSQEAALRDIADDFNLDPPPDAAVELNATSFDPVLKSSAARFAVVEFFAHWCPACRNYKPQYEKVAKLFSGPDAVHPGIVFMTRVDCAVKMNIDLCDKFSVGHYPHLLWGPTSKFVNGSWDSKKEQNDIKQIDDGRTADNLLNWINKQLGSSISFDDVKFDGEGSLAYNAPSTEEALFDVEESTSHAFDIIMEHRMIKSETRVPLIKFLQLLVAHHPSKRCRTGSARMLVNFDESWPTNKHEPYSSDAGASKIKDVLKSSGICGEEIPRGNWIFCRGSNNDTRGFSCGLWVLLHSLSVRVGDGESHLAFTSICDFIHNFFICDECRQHFHDMCSRVSAPFNTTRDFSLWLWSAHNQVNERLKIEEKILGTDDPKFPKTTWPSKQLCSSCFLSISKKSNGSVHINWDMDGVFNFLVNYYGSMLISSEKVANLNNEGAQLKIEDLATSNAVSVPLGAAFAIAVASCAFGAFAYYWRTQQKNRKYVRQLYSLNNMICKRGI